MKNIEITADAFGNALRQRRKGTVIKNAIIFNELIELFNELREFPYAVIKGEPLSKMAYGEEGYRNSADIDILVHKSHVAELKSVLEKHGFCENIFDADGNKRESTRIEKILLGYSHQTIPFVKISKYNIPMYIDINCDIFWGEYDKKRICMHSFLANFEFIKIYRSTVKTLKPLHMFVSLCLHHYREMNAPYYFKLNNPFNTYALQDVYYLYKNHIAKNIKEFVKYVNENNLEEYIFFVLYHTHKVFPDESFYDDMKQFETEEGVYGLEYYGLCSSERKKWPISFEQRFNNPNLFQLIEPQLTEADERKINQVLSIIL